MHTKKGTPADIDLYFQKLKQAYEEAMPFNKVLGFKVEEIMAEKVRVRIDMKPELVGNSSLNILHGGVISAVLDTTGGIVAGTGLLHKNMHLPPEKLLERFIRMGTIDLRVDYLRPGKGDYSIATGTTLRTGRKVAVTRMELYDSKETLIAVGTGTYSVA